MPSSPYKPLVLYICAYIATSLGHLYLRVLRQGNVNALPIQVHTIQVGYG